MKKRLFEVPYNFDDSVLEVYKNYTDIIELIYMPPFQEDMYDTRKMYCKDVYPKTKKEYEKYIQNILDTKLNPSVLFQYPTGNISNEIIKYYIDIGISYFIVNQDKIAYQIKNIYPEAKITASVTKRLSLQNIIEKENEYKELYHNIVLFFPFNRGLLKLKFLPKSLNYTFLLNNNCGWDCDSCMVHWFGNKDTDLKYCTAWTNKSVYIQDIHLPLFDKYAYSYKIQDRSIPTKEQIDAFIYYKNAPYFNLENPEEYAKYISVYNFSDFKYNQSPEEKNKNIFLHYNEARNSSFLKI